MRGAVLTIAVGTLLLPVVLIGAATGAITGNLATSDGPTGPVDGIPALYLQLYVAASAAYGLPWELLAAIGKVECDHGQAPAPACTQQGAENHAGAGGPMQLLAGTWAMYGVDADHDGRADRWNPADAIYSAANYLRVRRPHDIRGAVFAYNHSTAYVDDVLRWAARYRAQATTTVVPGGADSTGRRNTHRTGGCDGKVEAAGIGSCGAAGDAVAGASAGGQVGASAAVLVGDRARIVERGRGCGGGRVRRGRRPVVPRGWRDAIGHAGSGVGALLVVR